MGLYIILYSLLFFSNWKIPDETANIILETEITESVQEDDYFPNQYIEEIRISLGNSYNPSKPQPFLPLMFLTGTLSILIIGFQHCFQAMTFVMDHRRSILFNLFPFHFFW